MRLIRFARRYRTWAVAALVLLASSVPTALYVRELYDSEQRVQRFASSPFMAQPAEDLPAIAILPFTSPESGTLLGVGMSRLVSTSLSSLKALRVTAYNSVRRYPDVAPDTDAVARELGVRYVLSGSAETSGNGLRVEAVLTDAAIGRRLWTASYNRNVEDLFAVRTELAEKVASTLRIEITADERKRIARVPTHSIEAYQAVLRGMPSYGRRLRRANEEARRHFEHAIELDPDYATAHGLLAMIYRAEFANDWGDDPAESLARAERLAKRALALDDSDAFPHLAIGMVRREQRRYADALAAFARAVELHPNYANAIAMMASTLCYAGQTENTIEVIQQAVQRNPRFPINYPVLIGQCYFAMGRYGEAIAAFEQALDKNSLFSRGLLMLAASYAQAGRLADARSTVKELGAMGQRLSLRRIEPTILFARSEHRARVIEGLRLAGVPD